MAGMLLAIDVGNTETTLGLFSGDWLAQHWRVATVGSRTSDEYALLLAGMLNLAGLAFPSAIAAVAIASVVPPAVGALRAMATRYIGTEAFVVEPGVTDLLPIRTDNPREVGADRVVDALAVYRRYGGPAIVVDFGTATTFDAISADGALLGAAIAPGVTVSLHALTARTARLPYVELATPSDVIGRNTVASIQSGSVFGAAGQVDGIVGRMRKELGGNVVVVATGGLAPVLVELCTSIDHHDPWLTLHGLRLASESVRGLLDPGPPENASGRARGSADAPPPTTMVAPANGQAVVAPVNGREE